MTTTISAAQAARLLVAHTGLAQTPAQTGAEGLRAVLARQRCIQLDPLAPIGTNADLVALARLDGVSVGDVYTHLLAGHAFEHFAKERCLLPANAFPWYRDHARETVWWRDKHRLARLGPGLLDDVLAEITERGPVAVRDLTDRGRVEPLDWNGWKGTSKATSMATEVLWRRCEVVVCGRSARGKLLDVPARALPSVAGTPTTGSFDSWALLDRVEAAVLLSRASGPHWSTLDPVRKSTLPDALIASGQLLEIQVAGGARRYLAPPDLLDRPLPDVDDRLRILGPLDHLIWDRNLVQHAFGFEYLWEVYKPAAKRHWGWYVVPLLHRGALVGRLEAVSKDDALVVRRLWREAVDFDDTALAAALDRHALALGLQRVEREDAC